MKPEAIIAVVHTLIHKNISASKGRQLTGDLRFREDLGAHDLDMLQLIMDIEDERRIDFTDDEIEGLQKVGDLESLACEKIPHDFPELPTRVRA